MTEGSPVDNADPALQDPARHQRTAPQRQAPLRRPPLGLPASMGSAVNSAFTAAVDSGTAVGSGVQGFVERGVDTAYTVIDAYMRRGLEAAQRQASAGFSGMGTPGAAGAGPVPPLQNAAWAQAASSLAGPWAELVRAWADGLAALAPALNRSAFGDGTTAPSGPAPAPSAAGAPTARPAPAAGPAASPRAKVTLEFMSRQVAGVSLSLEPGADLVQLQARWTGAADATHGPAALAFYSEPGHVHLRLTLADPPLPGRHHAVVTDRDGQHWGSVTLSL